jgi:endo-1,4-beta-xylanase
MYPGLPETMALPKRLPPMFLRCGAQDSPAVAARLPELYRAIVAAGGAAELHILGNANHGFGMRESNPPAVAIWPTLFYNWLAASGFLQGS